jgi:hypothetical protein
MSGADAKRAGQREPSVERSEKICKQTGCPYKISPLGRNDMNASSMLYY